jgi:hypothetical protein
MEFKIGADPEIFLGDNVSVRSVIGKVGGTKDMPLALPIGDGFSVQEDNVALEFNVPAASNRQEWIANMAKVTGFLEQAMKDRYGLHFVKDSAVSFPEEEMYDPAAFVFGCDPDYCAWDGKRNPKPKASDPNLRSCGGHVHIGLDGLDPFEVIKGCDLVLGVPSVLMDKGDLRKQLYGKAGAHRIKPYGVEYRTLSNFWVFTDELTGWVYDGVSRVLDLVSNGFDFDAEKDNIISAINNNNKELAQTLVNRYKIITL